MRVIANIIMFSGGAVVLIYIVYFIYMAIRETREAKVKYRENNYTSQPEHRVVAYSTNPKYRECRRMAKKSLIMDLCALKTYRKMADLEKEILRHR